MSFRGFRDLGEGGPLGKPRVEVPKIHKRRQNRSLGIPKAPRGSQSRSAESLSRIHVEYTEASADALLLTYGLNISVTVYLCKVNTHTIIPVQ